MSLVVHRFGIHAFVINYSFKNLMTFYLIKTIDFIAEIQAFHRTLTQPLNLELHIIVYSIYQV